jgi:hypothetical protein
VKLGFKTPLEILLEKHYNEQSENESVGFPWKYKWAEK